MTANDKNQWIDMIQTFLSSHLANTHDKDGGLLNKIEGVGESLLGKITGKKVDIPDNAKQIAEQALSVLKNPAATDQEAEQAVQPLQFLEGIKSHFMK